MGVLLRRSDRKAQLLSDEMTCQEAILLLFCPLEMLTTCVVGDFMGKERKARYQHWQWAIFFLMLGLQISLVLFSFGNWLLHAPAWQIQLSHAAPVIMVTSVSATLGAVFAWRYAKDDFNSFTKERDDGYASVLSRAS